MENPSTPLSIDTYLRQQGVKSFTDPKRFWRWASREAGAHAAEQFLNAMDRRAAGDVDDSADFYRLLADPDMARVAASFEYGLLENTANWVVPHLPQTGTIVELGCHTGLLTRYYARVRPNAKVVGVDISPEAIEIAREQASQPSTIRNVAFEVGDLTDGNSFPALSADCVVTGRTLSEFLTPTLRRRKSWRDYQYPEREGNPDQQARAALQVCHRILAGQGFLLVTERLSDPDRFNRLWLLLQESGFKPHQASITPTQWQDVAGEHRTWFFAANLAAAATPSPLLPPERPQISQEAEAVGGPTRLLLDGILAWQTWQALSPRTITDEGTLGWESGEEIHYELGSVGERLGYVYIASNVDLHLLTVFLPQERDAVSRDLQEYLKQLRATGAKT